MLGLSLKGVFFGVSIIGFIVPVCALVGWVVGVLVVFMGVWGGVDFRIIAVPAGVLFRAMGSWL